MTNKTLVLVIVGLIVVAVAAAALFYWQQTKPLKVTSQANNPSYAYQQPTAPSPSPAPATGCQRDFDQNKLAQNSGLNIKNREVEIDVKDFGKITVSFYDQDAPKTVANFLRLTDAGFYDCLTFHRIAKGFVIQGGDPTGTGMGGQTATGQALPDELNPNSPSFKTGYVTGVLAMANTGAANSGSSQFFITLADDNQALSKSYTIFGKVVSGMDVVQKIGALSTNPPGDGMPTTPVIMQSVKIIK